MWRRGPSGGLRTCHGTSGRFVRRGEPGVVKVADDSAKALAAPAYAGPVMLSWVRQWHGGQGMAWFWWPLAALTGWLAAWVAASGLVAWAARPKVRRARR